MMVVKRLSNGLSGGVGYSWSKILGQWGHPRALGRPRLKLPFLRRYRFRIPPCPPRARNPMRRLTSRRRSTFTSSTRCRDSASRRPGGGVSCFRASTTDGIFHYQSGFPLQTPNSTSPLDSVTFANGANSGLISVRANRVPGQPLFLHSLNNHNVNPRTTFFLNPAAWANPAPGTYANSKPFYGDYRAPRYPNEQLGFGKVIAPDQEA